MRKDIVIAVVAVVIVVALAFGLAQLRPNLPGTPSQPFRGDKAESAAGGEGKGDNVVMRVNGQAVTEREFALMLQSVPAEQRAMLATPEGRGMIADEIIRVKVLEQEAEKMGLEKDPEIKLQLAMMRSQLMAGKALQKLAETKSDEKIRAEYEKEKTRALSLRHILVAYAGGQFPARGGKPAPSAEAAMARANQIAAKLRAGADFGQTAAAESDDEQSASQGGSIGTPSPADLQQLGPEIASAVASLKPGQISAPVKSQYGIHVFKVEQPSLEDLRPMLQQRVRQETAKTEIERLVKGAKVDKDPKFFPAAPPQQQPVPGAAPKSQG